MRTGAQRELQAAAEDILFDLYLYAKRSGPGPDTRFIRFAKALSACSGNETGVQLMKIITDKVREKRDDES